MLGWLSALALAATPAPRCVEVIGTNDVHGHLEPEVHQARPAQPEQPAQPGAELRQVEQGGLAGFAGYLDVLRARYPKQILLVDGGDLFQGTVPSNLSKGAAVVAAYNALGYQATALGNHEFDFGPEGGEADPLGAIKKRLAESKFPFLACNVFDAKTGKRPTWKNLKASTLVTVNGIKIGIVGAITPDTPTVTVPLNVKSLEFRDPAPLVVKEAASLRKQGAKLVVLITHIGGECKDLHDPNDTRSCTSNSELWKLLDALPEGTLDVVVAGHTHKYIAQKVKGVAVSEAGSYSHSFGWIEACVAADGKVTTTIKPPTDICLQQWKEGGCGQRESSSGVEPAQFLGQQVAPDAKVEKTLAPFLAKVKAQQEAPIGVTTAAPILRSHDKPSPLGALVAEAIRAAVPEAQIGLTNAGGIRADLAQGPLKFGEVFEVLPFDNRVVTLRMTGAQLKDFIVAPLAAGHGYPQLAGAQLEYDRAHPEAAKVTLGHGEPLDPQKSYVLATNDFLANGGDGTKDVMAGVPAAARTETGILVRDAFLAFIKRQPQPIEAPQP